MSHDNDRGGLFILIPLDASDLLVFIETAIVVFVLFLFSFSVWFIVSLLTYGIDDHYQTIQESYSVFYWVGLLCSSLFCALACVIVRAHHFGKVLHRKFSTASGWKTFTRFSLLMALLFCIWGEQEQKRLDSYSYLLNQGIATFNEFRVVSQNDKDEYVNLRTKAERFLVRANRVDANQVAPYCYLGLVHEHSARTEQNLEDYQKAIEYLKGAIGIDSNRVELYMQVGDLQEAKGDHEVALRFYERAAKHGDIRAKEILANEEARREQIALEKRMPHSSKTVILE